MASLKYTLTHPGCNPPLVEFVSFDQRETSPLQAALSVVDFTLRKVKCKATDVRRLCILRCRCGEHCDRLRYALSLKDKTRVIRGFLLTLEVDYD
jgi:hypothetical protein